MAKPVVGQIGLGNMGGSLAKHLLDNDFDVIGYDISDDALKSFVEYGGQAATSNADVASNVDVLLTALENPAVIEQVYIGENGIVDGEFDELICIEQSTVPPETVRDLADDLEPLGIRLCDCPFLGGPNHCRNGTLTSPFGGDEAIYNDDRIQVLLETISKFHNHTGDVGTGKATKLVNNTISLGNTALALEAMTLGVAHGLEPEQLYETLEFAGATSLMFRVQLPTVLNRDFDPVFPVGYTQKDLRYVLRSAEEIDYPMNITSAILQQYTAAAAKGYADEDTPAIVKVFEEYIDRKLEARGRIERDGMDPLFAETQ